MRSCEVWCDSAENPHCVKLVDEVRQRNFEMVCE